MGMCVCAGSVLKCSFGNLPMPLSVLPLERCFSKTPMATIMDNKPFVNILPFGMCSSMANPTVAAATAAAMGVLTPMPCVPNTISPWVPGAAKVLIGNKPALNSDSKLMCAWAGVIEVSQPVFNQIQL